MDRKKLICMLLSASMTITCVSGVFAKGQMKTDSASLVISDLDVLETEFAKGRTNAYSSSGDGEVKGSAVGVLGPIGEDESLCWRNSKTESGCWWAVDLDKAVQISRVSFKYGRSGTVSAGGYRIEYYSGDSLPENEDDWILAKEINSELVNNQEYNETLEVPVNARFIRIKFTGAAAKSSIGIFRAYYAPNDVVYYREKIAPLVPNPVTEDFVLSNSIADDYSILWESDDDDILEVSVQENNSQKVTVWPKDEDTVTILEAAVTCGSVKHTIPFEVVVSGNPDAAALNKDYLWLGFDSLRVKSDIELPLVCPNGSTVKWESSRPEIISND